MNEEKFDDREIKMLYKENARRTAPDMERLWSRIESEIDKTDAVPQRTIVQTKKTTSNRKMIRVLISSAAAFILVVGVAAVVARNSASKDFASDKPAGDNVMQNDAAGGAEEVPGSDGISYGNLTGGETGGYSGNIGNINTDNAEENALRPEADNAADEIEGTTGETGGSTQKSDTAAAALSAEEEILRRTEAILRARVTGTEQLGDRCTYTLEVGTCYQPGDSTGSFTAQLESDIPLGLTVGVEYLIPVYEDGEGLHPAVYREAQIMLTDEGSIVFPALWTSLSEGAEDMGGGLFSAPAGNAQRLIEKWRSL